MTRRMTCLLSAGVLFALAGGPAMAQQAGAMTFFITSTGLGSADLGGLDGADRHCQALAAAVGAGGRSWHAYLSTQGPGAVNARDRIGHGPWQNIQGVVIAKDVAELHGANNLNKQTGLTEKGTTVNGLGDRPNMHDILTGTQPDGTAFPAGEDRTCRNWTSSGDGSAMLGHFDRHGTSTGPEAMSWNAAHASRGCSLDGLKSTGGAGLLYCFATN
jgi:hypothetical protein